MLKIGMSSAGKKINEELFADYAKNGIEAIEICPGWPDYKHLDYTALKGYSEKYGVALWSFHIPFQTTDIASADRAWRLCSLEYICELIKQASEAGIHKFVTHASTELSDDPVRRAETLAIAKESLSQLADFAANYGSVICVEDLPRYCLGNCSEELLDILSANDKLRICFDTNHLLGEDILSFVKKVGDKIETVHVSDYDYIDERHWLPGEGEIPWYDLYKALLEAGYAGAWMYEISPKCPKTILRDRDLTCADFARNAKEIFEGKPLTVFSQKIDLNA